MIEPKDIIDRYASAIGSKYKCKPAVRGVEYENGEHRAVIDWSNHAGAGAGSNGIAVRTNEDGTFTAYTPGSEGAIVTNNGDGLDAFIAKALA